MAEWDELGVTADPGRVHTEGRMVRATLEGAREQVAELFGVRPRQVVLTSGGTESINAAVWGVLRSRPGPVVLAGVEHSAVRDASARTAPVEPIAVDGWGRIDPGAVDESLRRCPAVHGQDAALVHCQWANHEVGTVQPVSEVVELCRRRGVPVHVDAAAAAGRVVCDLGALDADLVSVSAHKLGGPAGIGALDRASGTAGRATPGRRGAGAGSEGRLRERAGRNRFRCRGLGAGPIRCAGRSRGRRSRMDRSADAGGHGGDRCRPVR